MTNTANPNKNSRAEEIVHRDMPLCSARRRRKSIPKKTPPKDPSGRNPAPGEQAGLGGLRSRPIAEASVALCCRIAPGFLVLFARRSRAIRGQSRKLMIHESRGPIDWRKPYFPNQVGSRFDQ